MPFQPPPHTAWQALFKQYPALENILGAVVGNNPAEQAMDMVGPMAPAVGMARKATRYIIPDGWRMKEVPVNRLVNKKDIEAMSGAEAVADHRTKEILYPEGLSTKNKDRLLTHESVHARYGEQDEETGSAVLAAIREAISQKTPSHFVEEVHGVTPEAVEHLKKYLSRNDLNEASLIEEAFAAETGFQDLRRLLRE
ncbi:MAG: hypothetical protein QGG48_09685 [Desulfatiglandales bacterium]|nr:hypothetical protein [Desulfatiglandales bacterium]